MKVVNTKNPDLIRVMDTISTLEVDDHLEIVNFISVWSNGTKIRRYTGQDNDSIWHNPKDGFKKMVAILVEVDE